MTHAEPERLALQLQELLERRATLRGFLEHHALNSVLTSTERDDLERVIGLIDAEMAELRQRLESLLRKPGTGA